MFKKRLDYKITISGDSEYGPYAKQYDEITKNMEGVYGETEYPY